MDMNLINRIPGALQGVIEADFLLVDEDGEERTLYANWVLQ
jgi:hypothetical protein